MSTNPITSETSLKNRPALRVGLIVVWAVIAAYVLLVLVVALAPQNAEVQALNTTQIILNTPTQIQKMV